MSKFRNLHYKTETEVLKALSFNYLKNPTNSEDSIPQP